MMKKLILTLMLVMMFAANALAALNINTADQEALATLSGIGPAKAAAIIEYREAHGNFATVDDLQEVKGIGAKTLEKLRDMLSVED